MLKATLLCAAFVILASSAGCRRVVILNFNGQMLPEGGATVDILLVTGITPQKDPRTLSGLQQTLGYYDVSTENIVVSVQACHGTELIADGKNIVSPIINDEVTIQLAPISDPPRRCMIGPPQADAGTAGSGGEGVGGAAGSGDLGQGGAGVGGAGGMTTTPPDAGDASDGGTSTDTAECGTDTHGSAICDPPTGNPVPPTVDPTPECVQYCATMLAPAGDAGGGPLCPGIYTDAAECEAYCTLAQWSAGTDPQGDTLVCRNRYVMAAQGSGAGTLTRTLSCQSAGPNGKDCGTRCTDFCHAWSLICMGDEASCMATCDLDIPAYAQATCRMSWLMRAALDPRYCPFVDLSSSCRPPECPAP